MRELNVKLTNSGEMMRVCEMSFNAIGVSERSVAIFMASVNHGPSCESPGKNNFNPYPSQRTSSFALSLSQRLTSLAISTNRRGIPIAMDLIRPNASNLPTSPPHPSSLSPLQPFDLLSLSLQLYPIESFST